MPRGGENHAQGGEKISRALRARRTVYFFPPLANFSCTPLVVKLSDQQIKQVLRGAIYGHRKTDGQTKLYVEVASCHPLICLYVVVLIIFT